MIDRRLLSRVVLRTAVIALPGAIVLFAAGPNPVSPRAHAADLLYRAPVTPRAQLHADSDQNRIYDDLEARVATADPAARLPVLVTFDVPLEEAGLPVMRQQAGSLPIDARFDPEAAIRTRLTPTQIRALALEPHVRAIEGDDLVSVTRDTAVPSFGVTKARDDYGLTGDGDGQPDSFSRADHTIAVIDTGIDGGHADFAGGKIIGWADFVNGRKTPYDDMGHGTHVSSIAAGRMRNGVGGVAPGAALVGVKVIDQNGNAHASDIVNGINWALSHRSEFGIRVINLSVAGTGSGDGSDVMSLAIRQCVAAGITVCVAAGNNGPASHTIPAPGASPDAITVGTMIDPGKGGFALWNTSGRGPTADGRIKPDLVAPGYEIMAARAGTVTDNIAETGSSMATPFVAGVCSLLLEANGALTPAAIKTILRETAVDFGRPGEDIDYGAGRLDAYAAIRAAETPSRRLATNDPAVPAHRFVSGNLGPNGHDAWTIGVTDSQNCIAAVLIVPNWTADAPIRYQLRLLDPDGLPVAYSFDNARSQLIRFRPVKVGTYTLRIDALAGQGDYFVDLSCDTAPAALVSRQ